MPPGEDDDAPTPFGGEDEATVPDLQVSGEDVTLDETQQAMARARAMALQDESGVVARPARPAAEADELAELDEFTVEVDWEPADWEEGEEATVALSDHQLSKLRAAAASDDSEVFNESKRERPAPVDPAKLPLPPVLDPESSS